jgi:hypothetical protein
MSLYDEYDGAERGKMPNYLFVFVTGALEHDVCCGSEI